MVRKRDPLFERKSRVVLHILLCNPIPSQTPCFAHLTPNVHATVRNSYNAAFNLTSLLSTLPVISSVTDLGDIQAQAFGVEVHLVAARLQYRGDVLRILKLSQINITSALLDGISDEFCRACLTLGADDHGLFLLSGFVYDEGGALGFLLGDLFGFDCGCEFGGEGEVLFEGEVLVGMMREEEGGMGKG